VFAEPSGETVPTIGFINESIEFNGSEVTVYDLGGGPRIRAIWRNYYADVHGVVYVIDSSETDRFDEARQELKSLIGDEKIRGKPCLVYVRAFIVAIILAFCFVLGMTLNSSPTIRPSNVYMWSVNKNI